ncbi:MULTISPECIES: glycogen synthase GlgA [unclassified Bacillus (in: firmicutes)]|uniref:glycogen synthase GlgA n=1 Tax=unclassified Bacillus (in: firmicutes) TaxID=185979 RepID=UPI0008EF9405|nr:MULTISPECIES: glycogen synthase GlgA [unclassified Bacillus (in: firmicutes)]SFB18540.1 starch synthase [Bacillus sp. UNCCL13]SFQ75889.1 starch synthase [Bacillus sp. cl95]
MKVLFAVSECVPFVKSGGLADVAGSLPKELKKLGTDVRVILPKYGMIPDTYKKQMKKVKEFTVSVGWRNQYCGIEELTLQGVTFYFVDNEYYFNRNQLYGDYDDGERFAFFNRAVLESLEKLDFFPDVLHCHDWHTAMVPYLLRTEYYRRKNYGGIRTVFTIHNLQFQGIFPKVILGELLGLDDSEFQPEKLEFYGNVNFMKGALVSADKITTVSPTYKNEIQTEFYGEKLDGILRGREEDLIGILNGIDEDFYNPSSDPSLKAKYSVRNIEKKVMNKIEVQKLFELPENADVPLMTMITRLTKQKGLDLVKCVLPEILAEDIQFAILGTGDKEYEQYFLEMASQYPDKLKVYIGFDEELAHKLYAGSDMFLMPSLFEPCGLGQIIAMKYGSVPIVRETGGLNDTVQAWDEFKMKGNGFSFGNFNAHDMLYTVRRAVQFYHGKDWSKIVEASMKMDYSWANSAFQYSQLYAELVARSETHVF